METYYRRFQSYRNNFPHVNVRRYDALTVTKLCNYHRYQGEVPVDMAVMNIASPITSGEIVCVLNSNSSLTLYDHRGGYRFKQLTSTKKDARAFSLGSVGRLNKIGCYNEILTLERSPGDETPSNPRGSVITEWDIRMERGGIPALDGSTNSTQPRSILRFARLPGSDAIVVLYDDNTVCVYNRDKHEQKILDGRKQMVQYKFLDINFTSDYKTLIITMSFQTYLVIHDFNIRTARRDLRYFNMPTFSWNFFTPYQAWNNYDIREWSRRPRTLDFLNRSGVCNFFSFTNFRSNKLEIIRKDFEDPANINIPEITKTGLSTCKHAKYFVTQNLNGKHNYIETQSLEPVKSYRKLTMDPKYVPRSAGAWFKYPNCRPRKPTHMIARTRITRDEYPHQSIVTPPRPGFYPKNLPNGRIIVTHDGDRKLHFWSFSNDGNYRSYSSSFNSWSFVPNSPLHEVKSLSFEEKVSCFTLHKDGVVVAITADDGRIHWADPEKKSPFFSTRLTPEYQYLLNRFR